MATPSSNRPHAISTPKTNPGATPGQLTSSPHPGASAAMARGLSHKSPSTKTPSASGHGHGHHQSLSSQPSSTPFAAHLALDDPMSFHSPAGAMMANLGSHGLTPLGAGHDGLGITDDLHGLAMPGAALTTTRDTEEERMARLSEVVITLETRIGGRGVCREGVERIANAAGLNSAWPLYGPKDKLGIAGNCVDLEVEFDSTSTDTVTDVILKYGTTILVDGEKREEASAILKENLVWTRGEKKDGPWKSMDGFKENITRLGKMDQLSKGINCFEAVEGLYESFQRIWAVEKKRLQGSSSRDRLCESSIGRPVMHKRRKIGLGLEYWVEKRKTVTAHLPRSGDNMDIDAEDISGDDEEADEAVVSTMTIDCETGMPQYPPIRISKEWVSMPVLVPREVGNANNKAEEDPPGLEILNWYEPPPTLVPPSTPDEPRSPVGVNSAEQNLAKPPNVQYCFSLEPSVALPYSVISNVYNTMGLHYPYALNQAMTYEAALEALTSRQLSSVSRRGGLHVRGHDTLRRNRMIPTIDSNGRSVKRSHSYSLHPPNEDFFCLLQSVPFSHPRQLVVILPYLRQYTVFSHLVRNVFFAADSEGENDATPKPTAAAGLNKPWKKGTHKVNNIPKLRTELAALLGDGLSNDTSKSLPIDVKMWLPRGPSNPNPSLEIYFPTPAHPITLGKPAGAAHVALDIGLNGQISVSRVSGLPPLMESEKGREKIAKVLMLSEDIGVLTEWLLAKHGATEGQR